MSCFSEEKLLRGLIGGNKKAFRRFYKQTKLKLLRWVKTRVKNEWDAEEIVQDTYLSFLDSLPLYRGGASLKTFLFAIGRHEVMDYWRKKYAKKAIRMVPFVDQVYTEKLYSAAETGEEIERVYRKLEKAEAMILRLKYEDDMSVKQIAARLNVSVKAAESRLFRARQAFQLAYSELSER